MTERDLEERIVGTLLDQAAGRVYPPAGGAKAAIRRARHRRRLRLAGVALVLLVASAALVVPLITLSALQGDRAAPRQTPPPQTALLGEAVLLDEGGVRLLVPADWDARADPLPGFPRKVLQVATFALPPLSDYEASSAQELMGPDDALIVVVEYLHGCAGPGPRFEALSPPLGIGPEDFDSPHDTCHPLPSLSDLPAGHSLARKIFELEGRLFDLRVEFGSDPAPNQRVAEINQVLGTFSVGRYQEVPDGLCRKQELGFEDPDCPEPQWVRRILEQAEYELVDPTGIFVARGDGTEFFVWAEELTNEHTYQLNELGFPEHEEVDGVSVFGGDEEWRWRVQGLEVYVADGPSEDSVFPTFEQIEALVRASIEVPYQS